LEIFIDKTDESITGHIRKGNYENETILLFKKNVRDGMTVLDIGANIGFHTLILAKLVGKTGKVFAFEPSQRLFDILHKNIKHNQFSNITAIKSAVSNQNGKTKLFINEHSNCNNKLFDNGSDKYEEVDLLTIDTYLKGETKIDFIKIDIEGAEALAFQGMMETIKKWKPIIYSEFVPRNIKRYGTHAKDMLESLEQVGYLFIDTLDKSKTVLNTKQLMERYPENDEILATNIYCSTQLS
jgi:FkbM family methyltransferase